LRRVIIVFGTVANTAENTENNNEEINFKHLFISFTHLIQYLSV
jgi:hypothetical protein